MFNIQAWLLISPQRPKAEPLVYFDGSYSRDSYPLGVRDKKAKNGLFRCWRYGVSLSYLAHFPCICKNFLCRGSKWDTVGGQVLALLGEYEHTLDEKGRLTLPSRLRPYFEGGIVITKGVDRCLFAFPPEEWATFKANIKANADLSAKGRQLSRMFFSTAFEAALDKQGRVLVPPKLAGYAGLSRDVTVAGVDDRLEIWDTNEWNRYVTGADEAFADIVEEFAGRDLGA
jgi:transcriptional regulator MraZ